MEITVSQEQGRVPVTVFHVKGDISADTADQLQKQAEQAYQAGARNLLIDLSEVPYISSYGIRTLSAIYKILLSSSGEPAAAPGARAGTAKAQHLKLVNPRPEVQKVLEMTGLDLFIEIHHDNKEAVSSFS